MGLKLYYFTILAAAVEPSKFVIRSHNGAIMCLFGRTEDKFELEQVISVQFRKRLLLIVRNVRIHHLTQSTKHRNTQTTEKAIQLRFHRIRCVSEHLELLQHRATTIAGKPVSVLGGITQEMSSFLPSW